MRETIKFFEGFIKGRTDEFIKLGAIEGGMNEDNVYINSDPLHPEITARQIADNSSDEIVFFKASNKINLRRIIDILKKIQ